MEATSFPQMDKKAEASIAKEPAEQKIDEAPRVIPPTNVEMQGVVDVDPLSTNAITKRRERNNTNSLLATNEISGRHNADLELMYQKPETCRQCCCKRDILFVILMVLFVNSVAAALFVGVLYMSIAMGDSALWVFLGAFILFGLGIITATRVGAAMKRNNERQKELLERQQEVIDEHTKLFEKTENGL